MNVINNKRSFGFTLIELLFASALLVTFLGGCAYMVMSAIHSQEFERSVRNAQDVTRNSMNRMADELRTACVVPSAGTSSLGFVGSSNTPSGVLFPDSYAKSLTSDFGTAYEQNKGTYDGKAVCRSHNRLIFTRANSSSSTFDASDISKYVYVDWVIPQSHPDRVWRRVLKIGGVGKCGHSASMKKVNGKSSPVWSIVPSYFDLNSTANLVNFGSASASEKDWLVGCINPDMDNQKRDKGGSLVTNRSTIEFYVSHPAYRKPGSAAGASTVEYESMYYTSYDRQAFTIEFKTVVFNPYKKGEQGKTKIDLSTQVRLQSGN